MSYQIYLNWLPTLHPLSESQLEAVSDLFPLLVWKVADHSYLTGIGHVAGLPADISLDATGLFCVMSEVPVDVSMETLPTQVAGFGDSADLMYQQLTRLLHIHLFSHRLFPIHDHVSTIPTRAELIRQMHDRYTVELQEQQMSFNVKRFSFVEAVHTVAEKLLDWRLLLLPVITTRIHLQFSDRFIRRLTKKGVDSYVGRLLELLERRVALANVSEALYNCRGSHLFYEAFCSLHNEHPYESTDGARFQQTYNVLTKQYRDYTELVSSYMVQASALFIAVLAVFLSLLGIGFQLLPFQPTPVQKSIWFFVLVAAVYFSVYAFGVRRVAERYLEATKGLLEQGMRERGSE